MRSVDERKKKKENLHFSEFERGLLLISLKYRGWKKGHSVQFNREEPVRL